MKKSAMLACASALIAVAGALPSTAFAATSFTENFDENVGVASGDYGIFPSVGVFQSTTFGIEIQNMYPGLSPAASGSQLVELDTTQNSSMFTNITAGSYTLTFAYSPRPGVGSSSNGIQVSFAGNPLFSIAQDGTGLGATAFTTQTVRFNAAAGGALTFSAYGDSDGLGGFVDSVNLVGVPEPATWAMMLMGFGLIGFGVRASRKGKATAGVTFA